MNEKLFDIRDYEYFQYGNIFSGSVENFYYKIIPSDKTIKVVLWNGPYCLECSQVKEEKEFDHTTEGLAEAIAWIKQSYEQV